MTTRVPLILLIPPDVGRERNTKPQITELPLYWPLNREAYLNHEADELRGAASATQRQL